jgi:hypothetical protein
MEVGQSPTGGCSAIGKKKIKFRYVTAIPKYSNWILEFRIGIQGTFLYIISFLISALDNFLLF